MNGTRVGSVAAAAVLWAAFVAALQLDGTWERLGRDVIPLSAFASGFALLAYAVDREARGAFERLSSQALVVAVVVSGMLAFAAPRAFALLLAVPAMAVMAAPLARRGLARRQGLDVRCRMHVSRDVGPR